jgi:hypothetical protein
MVFTEVIQRGAVVISLVVTVVVLVLVFLLEQFLEPLLFGPVMLLIIRLVLNLCMCGAPTGLSIVSFAVLAIVVSYGPIVFIVNGLFVRSVTLNLLLEFVPWYTCFSCLCDTSHSFYVAQCLLRWPRIQIVP